jgi:AAA15 family ATPase/GTPase
MTAEKITEHKNRVVSIGGEKLLRIAAIYGANGGGKSNVIDAFNFMRTYVLDSLTFGGLTATTINEQTRRTKNNIQNPFAFDDISKNNGSEFEVFFIDKNGKTYQYGFIIKALKVIEEWLYIKAKTSKDYKLVFYRNTESGELNLEGLNKNQAENIKNGLEDETLIISLGAQIKIEVLKMFRNWFSKTYVIDFSMITEDRALSNNKKPGYQLMLKNDTLNIEIINFLQSFDESISSLEVKQTNVDDDNPKYVIYSGHKKIDSKNSINILFDEESSGTKKMLVLFPIIRLVISTGSILFIDEMNAKLHPLLVRNLILMFADPDINKHNAQLIFTTHDTWQLSNDLLRRDEIWFVDKDKDGVTTLYSLADFMDEKGVKIRKDENYEKNYLLGKYGAIPSLKTINMIKEELNNERKG